MIKKPKTSMAGTGRLRLRLGTACWHRKLDGKLEVYHDGDSIAGVVLGDDGKPTELELAALVSLGLAVLEEIVMAPQPLAQAEGEA